MYKRALASELEALAKSYPVVTVLGPRQSGKTTLVRHLFKNMPYVSLEDLDVQEYATSDPRGFLEKYRDGAILDEIQRAPKILSYIQTIVDEHPKKGRFILTGSQQLNLHQAITQSLAGRTALVTLLPMSLEELSEAKILPSLNEVILRGGYPRIYSDALNPTKAYRNYFQTYVERDLRQLIQIKNLIQFQRFIRMCAGRVGQLLNLNSLGNDVGISSPTVKEWLSLLEASFIIVRLEPYFENFGKRLIKTSKLYFTDVGLATYLLGIQNISQLERHPLRGNLVENLVIMEVYKARLNQGLDPQIYYFRDAHGHEVDLIFQSGRDLIPVEIKASQTFHGDFLEGLNFFQKLVGKRCRQSYLVYGGTQEQTVHQHRVLHYSHAAQVVREPATDL